MQLYMDNYEVVELVANATGEDKEIVELVIDVLDGSGFDCSLGQIKDLVLYELVDLTEEEVRNTYGYDIDEGQSVMDYLEFNTIVYGTTDDGVIVFAQF